jgi:hypothetical protein
VDRLASLLDRIAETESGRQELRAIHANGNTLTLQHSPEVLLSAGRQGCAGRSSTITLDLRVPDDGAVQVEGQGPDGWIPFPLDTILAHELRHARRCLEGGNASSETDAIIFENVYRTERAARRGEPFQERTNTTRAHDNSRQVWFPRDDTPECGEWRK